eukprot:6179376-Pleurochrysis_carterae.AAC.2
MPHLWIAINEHTCPVLRSRCPEKHALPAPCRQRGSLSSLWRSHRCHLRRRPSLHPLPQSVRALPLVRACLTAGCERVSIGTSRVRSRTRERPFSCVADSSHVSVRVRAANLWHGIEPFVRSERHVKVGTV